LVTHHHQETREDAEAELSASFGSGGQGPVNVVVSLKSAHSAPESAHFAPTTAHSVRILSLQVLKLDEICTTIKRICH
ncbi:conserved hypothetical protein, partial [Ricinus communis]